MTGGTLYRMKNIISGKEFWELVIRNNPYSTLSELTAKAGIDYRHAMQQRGDNRMPKVEDIFLLSRAMGKSMEFLVTGKLRQNYPPHIEAIANRCMAVSPEDIRIVERILRIPHDQEVVPLKSKA